MVLFCRVYRKYRSSDIENQSLKLIRSKYQYQVSNQQTISKIRLNTSKYRQGGTPCQCQSQIVTRLLSAIGQYACTLESMVSYRYSSRIHRTRNNDAEYKEKHTRSNTAIIHYFALMGCISFSEILKVKNVTVISKELMP